MQDAPEGNTRRRCVGGALKPREKLSCRAAAAKAQTTRVLHRPDSPAEVGTFGHHVPGKSEVLASSRKNLEME